MFFKVMLPSNNSAHFDFNNHVYSETLLKIVRSLHSKDLISNSPYCLPYNAYDVRLENLVLDELRIL